MQLTRISVPITTEEREALRVLAKRELRDPREQVRFLLRQEFEKRGILSNKANSDVTTGQGSHVAVAA